MVSSVESLHGMILEDVNNHVKDLVDFHFRCIAHVVNLAVKESIRLVQANIVELRTLLDAIRCSVKRGDIFDAVKIGLGLSILSILCLDVETRRSFKFTMIRKA